jgi:poly-gamma-glutamate capsule biosynthesis protein CapA/YwtB (metallophosphatase superfamily)
VPAGHVQFAHRLVDAGVHVVHGHSSQHPRPIEVYRNRLSCTAAATSSTTTRASRATRHTARPSGSCTRRTLRRDTGELVELRMVPIRIRRIRLERAAREEARWLRRLLRAISGASGGRIAEDVDGTLALPTEL